MPSPVGHALSGVLIHALSARDTRELRSLPRAAGIAALALGPDLDFAVTWFVEGYRHQSEMHSMAMGLAIGVVCAIAAALSGITSIWRGAWIPAVAWLSHVVLDVFSVDTSPPFGPMALWPLSRRHIHSPISIFLDIWRAPDWKTVRHDAIAASWEFIVFLPICALVWKRQARRNSRDRDRAKPENKPEDDDGHKRART